MQHASVYNNTKGFMTAYNKKLDFQPYVKAYYYTQFLIEFSAYYYYFLRFPVLGICKRLEPLNSFS